MTIHSHTVFFALLGGFIAAIALLLPLRHRLLSSRQRLAEKLQGRGRIVLIAYLVAEDEFKSMVQFWSDSGRLYGLVQRLRDLTYLIWVMQIAVFVQPIRCAAAGQFYVMALAQIFWSVAALPEAAVCLVFPSVPHFCAKIAAFWHVCLTLGIQNEFFGDDTQESIGNLF